ncbi:hypothetical protein ABIF66_009393 [Bradyrhizobium japonicum]
MARLPISGVTISTPFLDGPNPRVLSESDLRGALSEICPQTVFTPEAVKAIYSELGLILGLWCAEQDRFDSSKLARAISGFANDLEAIAKTLSALQDGLHHRLDIEIVNQLQTALAFDPEVGSREQAVDLLSSFQKDAAKVAHAGLIAVAGLKEQVGERGRPQLEWHDDFTELLGKIAKVAGINPQFWKDREDGDWHGWLFEAAQKLEMFFSPAMRSPSREAAGKRLERSRDRLGGKDRQKRAMAESG